MKDQDTIVRHTDREEQSKTRTHPDEVLKVVTKRIVEAEGLCEIVDVERRNDKVLLVRGTVRTGCLVHDGGTK